MALRHRGLCLRQRQPVAGWLLRFLAQICLVILSSPFVGRLFKKLIFFERGVRQSRSRNEGERERELTIHKGIAPGRVVAQQQQRQHQSQPEKRISRPLRCPVVAPPLHSARPQCHANANLTSKCSSDGWQETQRRRKAIDGWATFDRATSNNGGEVEGKK